MQFRRPSAAFVVALIALAVSLAGEVHAATTVKTPVIALGIHQEPKTLQIPAHGHLGQTLSCPAGSFVMNGAWSMTSPSLTILAAFPHETFSSYFFLVENSGGSSAPVSLSVDCVRVIHQ